MKKIIAIALSIAMFSGLCAAEPNYLEFEPMTSKVNTPVNKVTTDTQILPLITWGGDIATIHANGNSDTTQPRSVFARYGLKYKLEREDVFSRQVENYMSGKTPFLRGTLGMIQAAATVTEGKPDVKPIIFYQMTWSAGGDALVVKKGINSTRDLKGKNIAIQADGPHVDYAIQILKDADLTFEDVNIKWLADLTMSPDSPPAALEQEDIDAAFMIIPDALALTADGTEGNGQNGTVAGAKILLSTKTASRVIADVYAVRADYYKENKSEVELLAKALLKAEKSMKHIIDNRIIYPQKYNAIMSSAAKLLLDDEGAIADTEGLYADCQYVSLKGNRDFFNNPDYLRGFSPLKDEISQSLTNLNLPPTRDLLEISEIDYTGFTLGMVRKKDTVSFNREELINQLITSKVSPQVSNEAELFNMDLSFQPNSSAFSIKQHTQQFARAIELASVYEGAVVIIEGFSDPTEYLRKLSLGSPDFELNRTKQNARNMSFSRAEAVKEAVLKLAKQSNISLNPKQFITLGHGIAKPKTGFCNGAPCKPKDSSEWLSNMYVKFRIIPLEALSETL